MKPKIFTKKSFGIICAKYNIKTNKIEFLLVKKRVSYAYMDFLLSCHKISSERSDSIKLLYLFNRMTSDEKLDILSLDVRKIWYRCWLNNPEGSSFENYDTKYYKKYMIFKKNFENNFLVDNGVMLRKLINKSDSINNLWEIPKGRPDLQESNLNCAIREFYEETGVSPDNLKILHEIPFTNNFYDSNILYSNNFYLAILLNNSEWNSRKFHLNYYNTSQISEISDISWFDLDKISTLNFSNNTFDTLKKVNKILRTKYKIAKLTKLKLII